MGYDDLDLALLSAWERAFHKHKDDPDELARVMRRRGMSTYTRPLRSWSLVLRANDKRIPDNHSLGLVRMTGAQIRALCAPVVIRYPGVCLDDAAALFGVNRTTIARWASPEGRTWWQDVQRQAEELSDLPYPPSTYRVEGKRLMLEHFVNRANSKRSVTRVWTPGFYGLDPAGEVWSAQWGSVRIGLAERIPEAFSQQFQRVDRRLGPAERASARGSNQTRSGPRAAAPSARVFQWVCPEPDGGCGRLVYNLYLPMPNWTLVRALGGVREPADAIDPGRFVCQRCAGLLYESSERTASPGRRKDGRRRRVDVWDRFLKRVSGGALTGRDIDRRLAD